MNFSEYRDLEIFLNDDPFTKTADGGLVANIFEKVKDIVMHNVDKDRPLESILNFLAPSMLWKLSPTLSILFIVADYIFGVDFKKIFSDIKNELLAIFKSGKEITEEHVNSAVDKALNATTVSDPDPSAASKILSSVKGLASTSSEDVIKLKKIIKIAERNGLENFKLISEGLFGSSLGRLSGSAFRSMSFPTIRNILSFFFKSVLQTLKMMGVAGIALGAAKTMDVADVPIPDEKGKGAWLGGDEKSKSNSGNKPGNASNKVIKLEYSGYGDKYYKEGWFESFPVSRLEDVLIQWAVKCYPSLDNNKFKDAARNSQALNNVVKYIEDVNKKSQSKNVSTFIPPKFESKKDAVDAFVYDVLQSIR